MKSHLFPPGSVALIANNQLCTPPAPASVRTGLQAGAAAPEIPCSTMLLEFPATPLPDEKIHRFLLARYELGLV
jgi:hypothetical protein